MDKEKRSIIWKLDCTNSGGGQFISAIGFIPTKPKHYQQLVLLVK